MDRSFVSIITPVYNAEDKVASFLRALHQQSYPRAKYEIILVDNGSTDSTAEQIQSFRDVTLLHRTDIQNPYAARNKGLTEAGGDYLVLLDINCTPLPHWLASGVKCLNNPQHDLVGGQISFTFSEEQSLGEWYDSLLFVDMEDLIERGNSCAGGNLFFKRSVLETIGLFPEGQRSGMDLYWTEKATHSGFSLIYSPNAEVKYPARKLLPLLKKVFRVGTGQPYIWLGNDMHILKLMALIIYQFIPPGISELKDKINRRGKESMHSYLVSLWAIDYLRRIVLSFGWTKGLFNYYFSS